MTLDEWTWGELVAAVEGYQTRQRKQAQAQALTAYRQAELIALAIHGKRLPDAWEAFPFWTTEDIKAARVAKYQRIMERYAAQGGKTHV